MIVFTYSPQRQTGWQYFSKKKYFSYCILSKNAFILQEINRAVSSVGSEHYLDKVGVTGSSPVRLTDYSKTVFLHRGTVFFVYAKWRRQRFTPVTLSWIYYLLYTLYQIVWPKCRMSHRTYAMPWHFFGLPCFVARFCVHLSHQKP